MKHTQKNATAESVAITENLISVILEEVQNGMGYQMASGRANTIIRKAVIHADKQLWVRCLSAIAQNAIRYYRGVYFRPDYYAKAEKTVKVLIVDLMIEVENSANYKTAKEKAYTRIYQSANPNYNSEIDRAGDFCYWNVPPIDSVMLMQARKLLKNAMK